MFSSGNFDVWLKYTFLKWLIFGKLTKQETFDLSQYIFTTCFLSSKKKPQIHDERPTSQMLRSVLQEMENAWNEYSKLERDVDWLRSALQGQLNRIDLTQVCTSVMQLT